MSIEDIVNLAATDAPKMSGSYKLPGLVGVLLYMKRNRFYPLLVWATTLFIAPFVLSIIESIYFGLKDALSDLTLIPIYWLFSLALSLPVLVIYWICFDELGKKITSVQTLRWILNVICISGIFISFAIVRGYLEFIFAVAYSVSMIFASFLFRIRKELKISN